MHRSASTGLFWRLIRFFDKLRPAVQPASTRLRLEQLECIAAPIVLADPIAGAGLGLLGLSPADFVAVSATASAPTGAAVPSAVATGQATPPPDTVWAAGPGNAADAALTQAAQSVAGTNSLASNPAALDAEFAALSDGLAWQNWFANTAAAGALTTPVTNIGLPPTSGAAASPSNGGSAGNTYGAGASSGASGSDASTAPPTFDPTQQSQTGQASPSANGGDTTPPLDNGGASAVANNSDQAADPGTLAAPSPALDLTPPGDQVSRPGDTVALGADVTNANGAAITYAAQGLPSGLSLDPTQGVITGTVDPTAASAAPYAVTLTASTADTSASQTFNWTVDAVTLAAPSDQSSMAGATVSFPLTASSAAGLPVQYSAAGLPPGVTIDAATGAIAGTVAADAGATGAPYAVTVSATDGVVKDTHALNWTVQPPVTLDLPVDQTNLPGESVNLALHGTGIDGAPVTYTADGLPPGLTLDATQGVISGTPAVGDDTTAPYTVTVTASDGTHTSAQTFLWNVQSTTPTTPTTPPADDTSGAGSSAPGDGGAGEAAAGTLAGDGSAAFWPDPTGATSPVPSDGSIGSDPQAMTTPAAATPAVDPTTATPPSLAANAAAAPSSGTALNPLTANAAALTTGTNGPGVTPPAEVPAAPTVPALMPPDATGTAPPSLLPSAPTAPGTALTGAALGAAVGASAGNGAAVLTGTPTDAAGAGAAAAWGNISPKNNTRITSSVYDIHYNHAGESDTASFYLDVTIHGSVQAAAPGAPADAAPPDETGTVTYTAWMVLQGVTLYSFDNVVVPFDTPYASAPDVYGAGGSALVRPAGGTEFGSNLSAGGPGTGTATSYGAGFTFYGAPTTGGTFDYLPLDPVLFSSVGGGTEHHDQTVTYQGTGSYQGNDGKPYQFGDSYKTTFVGDTNSSSTPAADGTGGSEQDGNHWKGSYRYDVTKTDRAANLPTTFAADASGKPTGLFAAPADGTTYLYRSFDANTSNGDYERNNSWQTNNPLGSKAHTTDHSSYVGTTGYRSFVTGTATVGDRTNAKNPAEDRLTYLSNYQQTGGYGGSRDVDLKTLGYKMTGTVTVKYNADGRVLANEYDVTDAYHRATKNALTDGTFRLNVGDNGKPATYGYEETDAKVYGDTGALTKNQLTYRQEASVDTKVSTSDRAGFSVAQVSAKGVRVGQTTGNRYDWTSGKGHAEGVWAGTINRLNNTISFDTTTSDDGSSSSLALYSIRSTATDGSRQTRTIASELGSGRYADKTTVNGTLNADGKQMAGDSFDHSESGGSQAGFMWTQRSGTDFPVETTLAISKDRAFAGATATLSYRPDRTANGDVENDVVASGKEDVTVTTLGDLKLTDGRIHFNDLDHRTDLYSNTAAAVVTLAAGVRTGTVLGDAERTVSRDYRIDRKIDKTDDNLHARVNEDGTGSVVTDDQTSTTFADGKPVTTREFAFAQTSKDASKLTANGKLADDAAHTGTWTYAAKADTRVDDAVTIRLAASGSKWAETGRTFAIDESYANDAQFKQEDDGLGDAAIIPGGVITRRDHILKQGANSKKITKEKGTSDHYDFERVQEFADTRFESNKGGYREPNNGDNGTFDTLLNSGQSARSDHIGTDDADGGAVRQVKETWIDDERHVWKISGWNSMVDTSTMRNNFHGTTVAFLDVYQKGITARGIGQRRTRNDTRSWWESLRKPTAWQQWSELTTGGNKDKASNYVTADTSWGSLVPRQPDAWTIVTLWQDFWADPAGKAVSKYGGDVLRVVGGFVDVVVGITLTNTGLGAIGGIPLIAVGLDQILIGAQNIYFQEHTPSVFEYAGYSAAKGLGASEDASQTVGAFTPAVLSLAFAGIGGIGRGFGGAGVLAGEVGASQSAGRSLFGLTAPPPSGLLSASLREQMLLTAQSPWFRWKVSLWTRLTGRGAVDWTAFMQQLGRAEFREFASVTQASRSMGWAGLTRDSSGWLFGVPRFGRNIPVLGGSMVQHELFHALQDLKYGMFGLNEAKIPIRAGMRIEFAANLFGGTLIGTIPVTIAGGSAVLVGYEFYLILDSLRILSGR